MDQQQVVYKIRLSKFDDIPGYPFAYWASDSLRNIFLTYPPLDRDAAKIVNKPKIADVKQGLATGDDPRFARSWWEIQTNKIASEIEETYDEKMWVPFAKGTHGYYHDISQVVNWKDNGSEIRNFRDENGKLRSRPQNEAYYFKPGLAWLMNPQTGGYLYDKIAFYHLPEGVILAVSVSGVFSTKNDFDLLAQLNSKPTKFLILLMGSDKDIPVGYISKVPVSRSKLLIPLANEIYDLNHEYDFGNETSTQFCRPWLILVWFSQIGKWEQSQLCPMTNHPLARNFSFSEWASAADLRHWLPTDCKNMPFSLHWLAEICVERERHLRRRLDELQLQIDEEVFRLYEISTDDRALIEAELHQSDQEAVEEDEEIEAEESDTQEDEIDVEDLMPAEEHICRLVHYLAHETLKADGDGIVPARDTYLANGRLERGLASRVKGRLAATFGDENLEACLGDLREAFGMPLEDWLETELFNYHVGLFRLRPILWQIASQQRGASAFSCFIYWHKLDGDTLRKIQQVYLRPLINAAQQEADRLGGQLVEQRNTGVPLKQLRELERTSHQAEERLSELKSLNERIQALLQSHKLEVTSRSEWVKEKVNEIVAHGYRPVLDYGVRVNIEPLKQAGILPVAASRVKG